ncbi:expressed unknown protein [Seminavis robusta]|uniref:Uncharacterized protein n=1 Tax=Seminavis robusta TaxID=568900 RepID=A0A9N8HJ81_9STRA|nr:expressed unknown protein [Seminavis robusta]|eukprot:Sro538_g162690.1 n/a (723) ;mRNA; f:52438-54606
MISSMLWRCLMAALFLITGGAAFVARPNPTSRDSRLLFASSRALDVLQERQTRLALVEAQLSLKKGASLQEILVSGQLRLSINTTSTSSNTDRYRSCVVLSTREEQKLDRSVDEVIPAVLLPLTSPAQLKLLSFAKASRPLSKSVLLGLNALLVNRDGALFDNLPWSLWSVDPQERNYDAARNPIDAKFHLGKRDAYNRLMGKDWQGRSLSIGNMALRLKYMLEREQDEEKDQEQTAASVQEATSKFSLAQRILEVQIRELEMDLAEWDYQLAVARNNQPDQVEELDQERQSCQTQLEENREKLKALLEPVEQADEASTPTGIIISILNEVADWTTDYGKNKAPYRGAMGYAPLLDTIDDIEGSTLPYTSPYDVLKEILDDQLNCEVIGAVLENSSLLEGTLALEGALILRRKTAQKTINLAGEELTVNDQDEDFGNQEGKGGETMLVECDGDEALAMALTCNVPIHLEPGVWDRANVLVSQLKAEKEATHIKDVLPLWKARNPELTVRNEGDAQTKETQETSSPIQIPRTTTSLFDSIFEPTPEGAPSGMFPTDNPIQSLDQYDELNDEGKARTLMTISNFNGKLPRPRVLRKEESTRRGMNTLDDLLVPLIDESARRQYLMRDAELRGDTETIERLQNEKTRRQLAKEKAEVARAVGDEDAAERWEAEAELYGDLRADVTQDEGAYSRFLDRDEWYERSRRAQAKKLDKKKFGTLLDGIE